MEIILKQDVKNLGDKDQIVKVKNGYALNYLIPRGMALIADESAKKVHAENMRQRAHKETKLKEQAAKNATSIAGMLIKIGAKAGENGKIFGSVTALQIADSIKKLGFDVDRKNITFDGDNIKQLGTYTAKVKLHREVIVDVKFEVVSE
ncbi:MAG: 50S ribosomal protein L9 [Bacteroidia bacterium]|nr:50S ribosomal protein L9 [Bacteroidia bacterium]